MATQQFYTFNNTPEQFSFPEGQALVVRDGKLVPINVETMVAERAAERAAAEKLAAETEFWQKYGPAISITDKFHVCMPGVYIGKSNHIVSLPRGLDEVAINQAIKKKEDERTLDTVVALLNQENAVLIKDLSVNIPTAVRRDGTEFYIPREGICGGSWSTTHARELMQRKLVDAGWVITCECDRVVTCRRD